MKRHRALRSTVALVVGWIMVRGVMLVTMVAPEIAPVNDRKILPPSSARVGTEVSTVRGVVVRVQVPEQKFAGVASSFSTVTEDSRRAVAIEASKVESGAVIAVVPAVLPLGEENEPVTSRVDFVPEPPERSNRMEPAVAPYSRSADSLSPFGSAWALVREGGGRSGLATNGQLGGSQIGARLAIPVSLGARLPTVALHSRLSTALEAPHQSETGVGILLSVKARLPVQLIVERRIRISEGGRNAFAIIGATGFDDRPVLGGLRASGYAQVGIVGKRSRDGFVDGAFRLEKTITSGKSSGLRLGGGVWGAAQPGIHRVDVGPRIARELDIGGRRATVALEWRERVAGRALPPSGLTLTIGSDF